MSSEIGENLKISKHVCIVRIYVSLHTIKACGKHPTVVSWKPIVATADLAKEIGSGTK